MRDQPIPRATMMGQAIVFENGFGGKIAGQNVGETGDTKRLVVEQAEENTA